MPRKPNETTPPEPGTTLAVSLVDALLAALSILLGHRHSEHLNTAQAFIDQNTPKEDPPTNAD